MKEDTIGIRVREMRFMTATVGYSRWDHKQITQ